MLRITKYLLSSLSLLALFCFGESIAQNRIEKLSQTYNAWDKANDVMIVNNYAYFASGASGLQIFDINDLTEPAFMNVVENIGNVLQIEKTVNYLLTFSTDSELSGRLMLWDLSDPIHPALVAERGISLFIMNPQYQILVDNDVIYVSGAYYPPCFAADVHTLIFNVVRTEQSVRIELANASEMVASMGFNSSVAIYEGYIFQGSHQGFIVREIETLSDTLFHIVEHTNVEQMAIFQHYLIVRSFNGNVSVLDIADPLNPIRMETNIPNTIHLSQDMIVNDLIYLYQNNQMQIFNIQDIENPEFVSEFEVDGFEHPKMFGSILINLKSSSLQYDLYLLNDVESLERTFVFESEPQIKFVASKGEFAYIINSHNKLVTIDISDPTSPVEVSSMLFARSNVIDLKFAGEILCILGSNMVTFLDVSNPEQIEIIGSYATNSVIQYMAVEENYVYLMANQTIVVDITNVVEPTKIAEMHLGAFMVIRGNRAYIAWGNDTYFVYDITDRSNPQELFNGSANGMQMVEGFSVFENFICEASYYAHGMFGEYRRYSLRKVDISRPNQFQVREVSINGGNIDFKAFFANQQYLFVRNDYRFNIYSMLNITLAIDVPLNGKLNSITSNGNLLLLAVGNNLSIYRASQYLSVQESNLTELPNAFELHSLYPNPFNSSTQIRFDLPTASEVKLSVFDINGRLLTNLLNGTVSAGSHAITWDASGMATGIYFVQLETANGAKFVQKAVMLR